MKWFLIIVFFVGSISQADVCDEVQEYRVIVQQPITLVSKDSSVELFENVANVFSNYSNPEKFYEVRFDAADQTSGTLTTGSLSAHGDVIPSTIATVTISENYCD